MLKVRLARDRNCCSEKLELLTERNSVGAHEIEFSILNRIFSERLFSIYSLRSLNTDEHSKYNLLSVYYPNYYAFQSLTSLGQTAITYR